MRYTTQAGVFLNPTASLVIIGHFETKIGTQLKLADFFQTVK